jgi:membrane dipeptidase
MTKPKPSDQALRLHHSTPVADLHLDILLTNHLLRYDIMKRHRHPLPFSPLVYQADIPRLQDAGVAIAGLGLVTAPLKIAAPLRYRQVRSQLAYLRKTCEENPRALRMIDNAESMHTTIEVGAIACLPGIEGAHALSGDLNKLDEFYKMGVRYFTLAHFTGNEACNCPKGLYNDNPPGLTDFGRKLVDRMQKLGIILDLAHTEKQAFMEAAERVEKPVIVSHTGIRGAFDHWRNIDDEQLEAVAKTGGVVGVMIAPNFLGGAQIRPLSDVTDHILHAVKIVGADHVGLGTDLDGWIKTMPKAFDDVADLPLITDQLLQRGLPEKDVKKILGENVVRVIDANLG